MKISQKTGLFSGKVTAHIANNDELIFTHEKMLNKNTTKFLLDHIDPLYESHKQFSTIAAVMSLTFFTLSIFLYWYGKSYFVPPEDIGYLFMSAITFIASLAAGTKALRSKLNVVCFKSHDGRRLFTLYGNKPSTKEVELFCKSLKNKIDKIKYNGEISSERMKEILSRHVEFLFENNVLSQTEKETALNKISNKTNLNVVKLANNEKNA